MEELIVLYCGTGTVAGNRVYVGQRLQSTALPAIVVRVSSVRRAALCEANNKRLQLVEASVSAISNSVDEAADLVVTAVQNIANMFSASDGALIWDSGRRIEDPVVGEGDENEPYIATQDFTAYTRY